MRRFYRPGKLVMISFMASCFLGCVPKLDMSSIEGPESHRNAIAKSSYKASDSSVDIRTRSEVIPVWLKRVNKSDHFVTREGVVYLAVESELYEALPKTVNGLKIERYQGSTEIRENEVPYILFTNWSRQENSVRLTGTAYFVGGNVAGCSERYDWNEGSGWSNSESKCFAAAS